MERASCAPWRSVMTFNRHNAVVDDEPETEEERAAVESSIHDPSHDIPFEQLRRVRA
jgi:hypothetical protein